MGQKRHEKPEKKSGNSSGRTAVAPYVNKGLTEIVYEAGAKKTSDAIIAFISGNISSAFIPTVTRGVEERVRELGKSKQTLVFHSSRNGTNEEAGAEIMKIIRDKSADAIIVLSLTPEKSVIDSAIKSSIPVVFIERNIPGLHSVMVDNYRGGFIAAQHLINAGRKKPGVITDSHTAKKDSAEHARLLGFKAGLKSGGIRLLKSNIVKSELNTIESGRICMERFGKKLKKLDSIFSVAGDAVAAGFMIEAKSQGIKIPRDLAVIGFDDMDVAAVIEPALTTIRQPITGMGRQAVDIIEEALKGTLKGTKNVILEAELIVRDSV